MCHTTFTRKVGPLRDTITIYFQIFKTFLLEDCTGVDETAPAISGFYGYYVTGPRCASAAVCILNIHQRKGLGKYFFPRFFSEVLMFGANVYYSAIQIDPWPVGASPPSLRKNILTGISSPCVNTPCANQFTLDAASRANRVNAPFTRAAGDFDPVFR